MSMIFQATGLKLQAEPIPTVAPVNGIRTEGWATELMDYLTNDDCNKLQKRATSSCFCKFKKYLTIHLLLFFFISFGLIFVTSTLNNNIFTGGGKRTGS